MWKCVRSHFSPVLNYYRKNVIFTIWRKFGVLRKIILIKLFNSRLKILQKYTVWGINWHFGWNFCEKRFKRKFKLWKKAPFWHHFWFSNIEIKNFLFKNFWCGQCENRFTEVSQAYSVFDENSHFQLSLNSDES